jgi:hypothetical protein
MVNYAMHPNMVFYLWMHGLIDPITGIREGFQSILYLFSLAVRWTQFAVDR